MKEELSVGAVKLTARCSEFARGKPNWRAGAVGILLRRIHGKRSAASSSCHHKEKITFYAVRSKIDRCGNLRVRHAERIRNELPISLRERVLTSGVWGESEVVARGRTGNGCRTNQGHSTQLKILGCIEIEIDWLKKIVASMICPKDGFSKLKPGPAGQCHPNHCPKVGRLSNREGDLKPGRHRSNRQKVRPQYLCPHGSNPSFRPPRSSPKWWIVHWSKVSFVPGPDRKRQRRDTISREGA